MDAQSEIGGLPAETLLQQITRTYYELLPAFEQHMGITRARWHVLKHLYTEDHLSQTALQQRANVDGAAITRQVKQLEEVGIVTRWVDPRDNRFTLVALTPTGRQQVAELMEQRTIFDTHVLAGIEPSEVAIIQRGLSTIRANISTFMNSRHAESSEKPLSALSDT